MSISLARAAALTSVLALVSCRYTPAAVPLQASAADIASLAGRWEGTYVGDGTGRSGNIVFMIAAGKDTAHGDVVMVADPTGLNRRIVAADVASGEHALHASLPELLRISLVRIRDGMVEGALEPYVAPDCHCTVTTVFRGAVEGNTIRGQYFTTGAYGVQQKGRWSVSRTPSSQGIAR